MYVSSTANRLLRVLALALLTMSLVAAHPGAGEPNLGKACERASEQGRSQGKALQHCGPSSLETMTVPSDGATVCSQLTLTAGRTYQLIGSGQITNSGGPGPDPRFDVEYAFDANNNTFDVAPDFGVKFSPNQPVAAGLLAPRWGSYDANNHRYEVTYTPDVSGLMCMQFIDSRYNDNVGSFTVEIVG